MDLGTRLFRSALLTLAGHPAAKALALRYGLKLGASRFVAGETLEEAVQRVKELNRKRIAATLDYLGEDVRSPAEANDGREEYMNLLTRLNAEALDADVSLKPTQLGLAFDPETACGHLRHIVAKAASVGRFVCLDMENSPYTDATLNLVRRLRAEGLTAVGTVLQACLRRSETDLLQLTAEGVPLRLVKGAYKEPRPLVYARKAEVDDHFIRLIRLRLHAGVYTAIATHDTRIIELTKACAAQLGLSPERYEFQMLYGVTPALQERLADEGFRVRCYVPYGRMWYPYFIRRLAERPANVGFLLSKLWS